MTLVSNKLDALNTLLGSACNVVLTTHHNPDGDALGSVLGLALALHAEGHSVKCILPNDFPVFFGWMPGIAQALVYTNERAECDLLIEQADLLCCLDFNQLSRTGEMFAAAERTAAKKLLVDHHLDPSGFEDFTFWDPEASSTAELIFLLIQELNLEYSLDAQLATCLYTGILTDTGSFRFPRTTAGVHRIIAQLIDAGANGVQIHELVFEQQSKKRLRFLGFCLKDKLVFLDELNVAYFALSAHDIDNYAGETGDTEGIVSYALGAKGVRLAVIMVERGNRIKLSFRSKGDFPCNKFAAAYFSGGGHKNAAGGASEASLEDTVKKFLKYIAEYQQFLLN